MKRKLKWLSRHSDGQHFPVGQKAAMKPRHWAKPTELAHERIRSIPINKIVPRELHPVDLERRVQYFINLIKEGRVPIGPILVQKKPDGTYFLVDGHARVAAYQRLGFNKIQATISKNPTELPQLVE
jgi:hypothetical protein